MKVKISSQVPSDDQPITCHILVSNGNGIGKQHVSAWGRRCCWPHGALFCLLGFQLSSSVSYYGYNQNLCSGGLLSGKSKNSKIDVASFKSVFWIRRCRDLRITYNVFLGVSLQILVASPQVSWSSKIRSTLSASRSRSLAMYNFWWKIWWIYYWPNIRSLIARAWAWWPSLRLCSFASLCPPSSRQLNMTFQR